MKEKRINLAGRLGNPSLEPASNDKPPEASNYGVSRLGIVTGEDGGVAREEILEYSPPMKPETPGDEPLPARHPLPPVEAPEPDVPAAPESREGLSAAPDGEAAKPSSATTKWFAVAAVVVVALAAWWVWRSVSSAPSVAAGQRAELARRPPMTPPQPMPSAPEKTAVQPAVGPAGGVADKDPPVSPPIDLRPAVELDVAVPPAPLPREPVAPPAPLPPSLVVLPPTPSPVESAPRPAADAVEPPAAPAGPPQEPIATSAPTEPATPDAEAKPVVSLACPPGFSVSAVMRWNQGPVAMINERLVGVGGKVNGAKVLKISDFSVEIELAGKIYMIAVAAPAPSARPAEDNAEPTTQPVETE